MSPEPNDFHEKDRIHHHSTPHHFKAANHGYTATIIPGSSPQYPTGPVPRYGTVIPNRVFVGGIEFKTEEEDLHNYFRHFGAVKDTKIIRDKDHSSKGYGFVTFEDPDDAERVRQQESFILNGKKLNIGPAVRKQPPFYKDGVQAGPPGAVPTATGIAAGSWVWHPSAGGYASWTNQNGITYFSPVPNPMITSLPQQPQIIPHGTPTVMATYNTSTGNTAAPGYPPMAPHCATAPPSAQYTASYPTAPCSNQVYGTVHVPTFSPPIAGACGQIITPSTAGHANVDQINMVPVPTQNGHPGYIVPRTVHPTPPQAVRVQVLPASTTPPSTYNTSTAAAAGGPHHFHQHPPTMVATAPAAPQQYNIVTLQQQAPHDHPNHDQSFHSQHTAETAELSQSVGDITFNEQH